MPAARAGVLGTAALVLALGTSVAAQDYPVKPVRIIVPFPPGAINDTVGRRVATQLGSRLGRQFVVDNRAGAGGVVGTELAANAPKDGYTLLVVSLVNAVNPWLYKLPYDPIGSFVPIAGLATAPNVLVVHPTLPVDSVTGLVALAKDRPGQLQYASGGVGSFQHLGGELFKLMAGIDLLHVPFKGGGPAMIDVIGGHTKLVFATTITALPHVRAGKLRALAVGERSAAPSCRGFRPSRKPACRATRPSTGSASWHRPARPPPSSPGSTRRFPRSRIHRRSSSSSRPPASRSCAWDRPTSGPS
jgi:tripartite-type tricarboxylate transporter receptor subunit TctC